MSRMIPLVTSAKNTDPEVSDHVSCVRVEKCSFKQYVYRIEILFGDRCGISRREEILFA